MGYIIMNMEGFNLPTPKPEVPSIETLEDLAYAVLMFECLYKHGQLPVHFKEQSESIKNEYYKKALALWDKPLPRLQ